MISDEYGFWDKLPEKDKSALVNILFKDMVTELDIILHGCEQAFINNFMVNLAYRKDYAGQVIQYGSQVATDMFIIWKGCVVVAERTEFKEPILIYTKGAAFNLYQIIMGCQLPFDYRAIEDDEYIHRYKQVVMRDLHYTRRE